MLRKWETQDEEIIKLWNMMNAWTFEGWKWTYAKLGCRFDITYLESETYLDGKEVVRL